MYEDIITITTEDISSQWENALEDAILKQVVEHQLYYLLQFP